MIRPLLIACLSLIPAAPLGAQDLLGFDATQFGRTVLTRKQSFGSPVPEVALGAYNNEPIATYSPKSVFARMGRAVGRLDILTDSGVFPCTAFIVGKATLLTNFHCVPGILDNPKTGATRIEAIQFVAGYTRQGVETGTRRYFVSVEPIERNRDLDYAVLRVIGDPSEDFGMLDLSTHAPDDGDPFWIIGHPMGEAQRISREKCRANTPALTDNRLLHTCDTLPGNSGSPVIDAALQAVVALHHAGSDRDSVNFAVPMGLILARSDILKAAPVVADSPPVNTAPVAPPSRDMSKLLDEVASMGFRLGKERESREKAQQDLARLLAELEAAKTGLAAADAKAAQLTDELHKAQDRAARVQKEVESLRAALAESEAGRSDTPDKLRALEDQLAAALAARLATEAKARDAREKLALTADRAAQADAHVEALNQNVATLRLQLRDLQAALDDANARDAVAAVRLQKLGSELNAALARAAQEERRRRLAEEARRKQAEAMTARLESEAKTLSLYRSEVKGRLRDALAGQKGVEFAGDRFVLPNQMLFRPGSADLSAAGQRELAKLAAVLAEVANRIPTDVDWILRVDGHTDNIPIRSGGDFADNWDLSQARALSVLRALVEGGFPAHRLSANGFGEFQPLDPANSATARARNRRIELSLTDR
ncbi:trypsin-like peptidase domain-containing protein [Antarctobacter sp.]|uniref:trypsin-like peptidase domain-containing protein n=1 Tax=Antarctobacter sp. TaxID=1872577 RepID=UPI003A8F367E